VGGGREKKTDLRTSVGGKGDAFRGGRKAIQASRKKNGKKQRNEKRKRRPLSEPVLIKKGGGGAQKPENEEG